MADYRDIAATRGHTDSGQFYSAGHDLHLAFAPNADLDLSFEATCLDTGESLKVNGWLFTFESDSGPEDDGQPDEGQEWHDFDPDC